ncbi:hypothetical protein FOA52_002079 [Chlamydomonas sp. UWO 241]|nr:hypothetical protein FOA52_002079 [Chlamydomonas sp. UWO 241]
MDGVPFTHSRLHSYAGRLDAGIDAKSSVAGAVALAASMGRAGSGTEGGRSSPALLRTQTDPTSVSSSPGTQMELRTDLQDEIGGLRAEIAGVESVLGYMRGLESGGVSATGKALPPSPSATQQRDRARLFASADHRDIFVRRSGSPLQATTRPTDKPSPASTWRERTPGGAVVPHTLHSAQTVGGALSPARGESGNGGPLESLTADLSRSRGGSNGGGTWRPSGPPVPVGRGDAVVLAAALEEAFPQGAIAAKFRPSTLPGTGAGTLLLQSQSIDADFNGVEAHQREAARQVAFGCADRGRLLIKIGERYREFFSALRAREAWFEAGRADATRALNVMSREGGAANAEGAALRARVAALEAELSAEKDARASAEAALEHAEQDTDSSVSTLSAQNVILAAEADQLQEALEAARVAGEAALVAAMAELEARAEAAEDTRDGLAQRLRFVEKQMLLVRADANRRTPVADDVAQTDPVQWAAEDEEEEVTMEEAPVIVQEAVRAQAAKKRPPRLGGFASLLPEGNGRVRGTHWAVAVLTQLYIDKIVADAVADRQSNPRVQLCEFTYDWHLTRYGLRNLAESNLHDLIASVKHHGRRLPRLRWFALFTDLADSGGGERYDTPAHIGFYLFSLQQLAYPHSIAQLFATDSTTDDMPVLLKQQEAQEAVRACFRYLGDPEAATPFLDTFTRGPGSVDVGHGLMSADLLLRALMAEYCGRLVRSTAHLKALFCAADTDDDGCVSYDDFVLLVRHCSPDITERLLTRMYSEAVRSLPKGAYLLPEDVFVKVAHTYGLDRWRIDGSFLMAAGTDGTGLPHPDAAPSEGIRSLAHAISLRLRNDRASHVMTIAQGTRRNTLASVGAPPTGAGRASGIAAHGEANLGLRTGGAARAAEAAASESATLLRLLTATLFTLDPPLEDMMTAAAARIAANPRAFGSDPDLSARLQTLHARLQAARTKPPSDVDATHAWLTFRLLHSGLTAVMARSGGAAGQNSQSRPGSSHVSGAPSPTMRLIGQGGIRSAGGLVMGSRQTSGLLGGDGVAAAHSASALQLRGHTTSSGGGRGRSFSPERLQLTQPRSLSRASLSLGGASVSSMRQMQDLDNPNPSPRRHGSRLSSFKDRDSGGGHKYGGSGPLLARDVVSSGKGSAGGGALIEESSGRLDGSAGGYGSGGGATRGGRPQVLVVEHSAPGDLGGEGSEEGWA